MRWLYRIFTRIKVRKLDLPIPHTIITQAKHWESE
nr:MAG TPA: TFIIH basal transcription factor complex initiation, DNA repair, multiprotein.4A [Caudoviricetes sp.]